VGFEVFPSTAAIGTDFGCVTDLSGIVICGGQNSVGQLGNGTFSVLGNDSTKAVAAFSYIVPIPGAAGFTAYSAIAAGRAHACGMPRYNPAILTSQIPRCWGSNTTGQVGDNATATAQIKPDSVNYSVAGLPTAYDSTSLVAGAAHTCALATAPVALVGTAWCWGSNGAGQVGSGGNEAFDQIPTKVAGGLVFVKLYAGDYHNCGLTSTGTAYCWGRNDYGQLGTGTPGGNMTSPTTAVPGVTFRTLSLGELFSCGVAGVPDLVYGGSPSQSAGTVYCWGDNSFGQLGIGAAGNVYVPTKVKFQP
jgi:alpha-tubulin suppressor-like RCC1 family protein